MRKTSILVLAMLVATGATARAQDPAPAALVADPGPPPVPPPAPAPTPAAVVPVAPAPVLVLPASTPPRPQRKLQLGVSVLAMALGTFTNAPSGMTVAADASFSYGLGVSAGYEVLPGLSLGVAPQVIFNVGPKEGVIPVSREYDLFARVAYSFTLVDTIGLYVEALPGYSLIMPPGFDTASGLVLAFGGGGTMDLSDRTFVSIGAGYQVGFQQVTMNTTDAGGEKSSRKSDDKTRYTRVALSGGVRF